MYIPGRTVALNVDRWMDGHAMTTSELAENEPAAFRAATMLLTCAVVPCKQIINLQFHVYFEINYIYALTLHFQLLGLLFCAYRSFASGGIQAKNIEVKFVSHRDY